MSELIEFLRARLDEDESLAVDAQGKEANWWWDSPESPAERHISAHNPDRVLRRVDGLRMAVANCASILDLAAGNYYKGNHVPADITEGFLCALAFEWRDHPDYREDWRP